MTSEDMHLACHMRPNGIFSQNGRSDAPQSDEFQQQGWFETVLRHLLAVARHRLQDVRLPQIETAAIATLADCGARCNLQGLPVFWTGAV
jgi:hypothetical protein